MKLFQLVRFASPNHYQYDVAEAFVIRAASELQARQMAAANCGDETYEAWLSEKYSTCTRITVAGEPDILCRDFTHG